MACGLPFAHPLFKHVKGMYKQQQLAVTLRLQLGHIWQEYHNISARPTMHCETDSNVMVHKVALHKLE